MEWRSHLKGDVVGGMAGETFWKKVFHARARMSLRMNAAHGRLKLGQFHP